MIWHGPINYEADESYFSFVSFPGLEARLVHVVVCISKINGLLYNNAIDQQET